LNITDPSVVVGMAPPLELRYFTPSHAGRALVLVRRVVDDVVQRYARLVELEEVIERAEQADMTAQLGAAREELVDTVDHLQLFMEELSQLGVELKDCRRGIVDFPAKHMGRPVCLCWMRSEEQLQYWHECDEGFASRQPIDWA
jgi:hypothetical protein